jgi:hypothetical protein
MAQALPALVNQLVPQPAGSELPPGNPRTLSEENLMRITVDQNKCIASGQCVLSAAGVFDQRDEDGIVVLLNPSPDIALA